MTIFYIIIGLISGGILVDIVRHFLKRRNVQLGDLIKVSEDRAQDLQLMLLEEQRRLESETAARIKKEMADAHTIADDTDLDDTLRQYNKKLN